ncbi:MAG: response regulator [Deltaproteobacteria bacterium]|nr:response regulator [Deltaproteobacteria bacterium]
MKSYLRRLYGSLTVRMVIPVVFATSLTGAGLYFFVLRAVSDFADRQIRRSLSDVSSELYDICDHNFTELMQSGEMDDERSVRIKKALTLGAIEDFSKRNLLACRVYEEGRGELLSEHIQPALMTHVLGSHSKGASSSLRFEGRDYYLSHLDFRPWNWRLDIVMDTAQYAPLIQRVKTAYVVTGILLALGIVILLVILEGLLRTPLNRIIAAIQKGDLPVYKGIHELEFLSDSISGMMKSLEERNWWMERLYHIAITNRGEAFLERIADALSQALGLDVLILKPLEEEGQFQAVASSGLEAGDSRTPRSFEGLPCQEIISTKTPIVASSGAWNRFPSARCLTDRKAESFVGLPLYDHDGNAIGVINAFGGKRALSEWDLNLLRTAGQMVAAEFELLEKEGEQEQYREQMFRVQKLESLAVLAGGIAHDFNNILMGIQGNASLLQMDLEGNPNCSEKSKNIERDVQRGVDLTRHLLGMARGGKYEVKPTDINQLIRNSAEMFGRTKKEISIRERYREDLSPVEVDRGQMEQVLFNLFINAWQAMPAGGEIFLQTDEVFLDADDVRPFNARPGRYVKISVTDTGVGMDEATRQRIFDPFFTTKEMGRGTGLGLASTYGIIKNHDGIINAYSEKGHGSTFHIYLPVSGKRVAEENEALPGVLSQGTETLLLVDDESIVIEVAKPMLEKLGYRVLTAVGGAQAIELYERNRDRVDLVILDMIMPEMGGGETFDRLKGIDPGVRVLLSSGYSLNGRAREILDRGCAGFIQKPFGLYDLSKKMREILDPKQPLKGDGT